MFVHLHIPRTSNKHPLGVGPPPWTDALQWLHSSWSQPPKVVWPPDPAHFLASAKSKVEKKKRHRNGFLLLNPETWNLLSQVFGIWFNLIQNLNLASKFGDRCTHPLCWGDFRLHCWSNSPCRQRHGEASCFARISAKCCSAAVRIPPRWAWHLNRMWNEWGTSTYNNRRVSQGMIW